jgi:hypothetical protein
MLRKFVPIEFSSHFLEEIEIMAQADKCDDENM